MIGFIISHEEADKINSEDLKNNEVIYPYLDGEDLNSS